MATAKNKFQKLVFNPTNQKLVDFLDEYQKLDKDAFGIAVHAIIEQVRYAKMPPHLKKPRTQAHLENGTYEQVVEHLETELELNGSEAADELRRNTGTHNHNTASTNADRPKPTCHFVEKPRCNRNQCCVLKKPKEPTAKTHDNPEFKNWRQYLYPIQEYKQ